MISSIDSYSRGALAKQTGVNAETIRYYETVGLMPDPPRSHGGHRVYDETHLQRLSFIRRCRELGFTLDETRGFLALVDAGRYTCAEIRDRTLVHLGDVRERIADLRRMEKVLEQMVAECTGGLVPDCPIIEELCHGERITAAVSRRKNRRIMRLSSSRASSPSRPPKRS